MKSLEDRIETLESENRRYRRLLMIGALAICAFAAVGFGRQAVQDKVQAKTFEVVDKDGKVLVRLGEFEGNGAVSTFNPSGQYLCDIVPTKSGSGGTVFYDGKGKQTLTITDVVTGGGSIVLKNAQGLTTMSLGQNSVSGGSMIVNNGKGAKAINVTCDTEGDGAIVATSASGKEIGRFPAGN